MLEMMVCKTSNLELFLLMFAIVGLNSEESPDLDSSVEDDAVTISNCYPRDSESESSSSDTGDTNRQCMSAYILRRSGNITLNDNPLGDPNGFLMSLEVTSLKEVSPCGEYIISAGHSYRGFSDQRFHFSEIQDGVYSGIAVKYVSMNTTLTNSAIFKIHVYLVNGFGIINNGDEAIAVRPGVAKINVQITNWPFCGEGNVICGQCPYYEIGKYLDLEIGVKGTLAAALQEQTSINSGLLYSFGRGKLVFSEKVQFDGNDTVSSMPTGYPRHKRHNEKDMFYLRFPKFTSEMLYDPYSWGGAGFGK